MEKTFPSVHGINGVLRIFFEFTDFFRAFRVQKAMSLNAYKKITETYPFAIISVLKQISKMLNLSVFLWFSGVLWVCNARFISPCP